MTTKESRNSHLSPSEDETGASPSAVPAEGETGIVPFSRRVFFQLCASVGALSFLGTACGGRVAAYADEAGNQTFVVYIISREEVPIMVLDESKDPAVALTGAKVTITSNVTPDEEPIVVTTGTDGFAVANVRKFSYQRDDDTAKLYNFWGSVSLDVDGYRSYYEINRYMEAGTPANSEGERTNTILVPTQPLDGNPYLRRLTFDNVDAQYTQDTKAPTWSGNTSDHDVLVEVITPQPGQTVNISVEIGGVTEGPVQETSTGDSLPTAAHTFTRKWLQEVAAGSTMTVTFGLDGGNSYTFVSPLIFAEPILVANGEDVQNTDFPFSPGLDSYAGGIDSSSDEVNDDDKNATALPEWMQFAGTKMLLSLPFSPIQFFFDYKGNFGVTANLLGLNFLLEKNGKDVLEDKSRILEDPWNKAPEDTLRTWWNTVKEDAARATTPCRGSRAFGMSKFSSKLNAKFELGVEAVGTNTVPKDADKAKEYGTVTTLDAYIEPAFLISIVISETFFVVYVPIAVIFDFSAKVKAKIGAGIQFYGAFHEIGLHRAGSGCIVNFAVEAGLTVGIGIAGVASVGVRGYGQLSVDIGFGNYEEGKDCPHCVVSGAAGLQIVVQLLFFKTSADLILPHAEDLADNWKSKKLTSADVGTYTGLPEVSEEDLTLVVDRDLTSHVEATGEWKSTEDEAPLAPTYSVIRCVDPTASHKSAEVIDLFNIVDASYATLSPVNGLVPADPFLLYESAYSNPRIRIIHTDACSFSEDRAFMVRVVSVAIEAPKTIADLGLSSVTYQGEVFSEGNLVVDDRDGNLFVVPTSCATNPCDDTTVTRTRLAVTEWDKDRMSWGDAYVLDFSVPGEIDAFDRVNSHDIDFDVDLYDGHLLIALTSIQRPDSNALADYDGNQYLSLVRYDIDKKEVVAGGSTFSSLGSGLSLSHPHILVQAFDEGSGAATHCVVYSYASTFDASGNRTKAYIAATVFDDMQPGFTNHRYSAPTILDCKELANLDPDTLVAGSFEVSCPDRSLTYHDEESNREQTTVMIAWTHVKTENTLAASFVFLQTFSIVKKESADSTSFDPHVTTHDTKSLRGIGFMAKLGRTMQSGVFSYPDATKVTGEKPLNMVTFDQDNWKLDILEDTGETSKTQYFASFNGRRIYCVRTMDGQAPGFSEDTAQTIAEGATVYTSDGPYNAPISDYGTESRDVKLYQLLEARWVDGSQSYFDFYPIAQVPFIPDNIGVIAANENCTAFTFAQITLDKDDASKDKSDIYQVNVPVVMASDLKSAQASSPFAAPGDTCYYLCEIANCGNAPITSITMQVSYNGSVIDETTYDDLSLVMKQAPDDVKEECTDNELDVDGNGIIAAVVEPNEVTAAGILWPGKSREFEFGFPVPIDIATDENVTFDVVITKVADHMDDDARFASLVQSDGVSAIPLLAADAYVGDDVYPVRTMLSTAPMGMQVATAGETSVSGSGLGAANYKLAGSGDEGATDGGSGSLAKTGDDLAKLVALGVAAAAGATAYAAKKKADAGQEAEAGSEA